MDRYIPEERVLAILARTGAVLVDDHFVYTSGKHGSAYVNKDAVYPDVDATDDLCRAMAYEFRADNVEVVVGPEVGGIILQHSTAYHLRRWMGERNVIGVYIEKASAPATLPEAKRVNPDGTPRKFFAFNRGYAERVRDKRVLVVDDILITGGSAEGVVHAVAEAGGEVVGVAVLVNRGGVSAEAVGGVPRLFALANVSLEAWPESDCPLCREGRPVNTKIGKGREFLERQQVAA